MFKALGLLDDAECLGRDVEGDEDGCERDERERREDCVR